MEQIISFFQFDEIELGIIISLVSLSLIILFYYCYYYNRPLSYQKKKAKNTEDSIANTPPVSIIITVKDESYYLEQNLPKLLTQDYPNYEVIVVNNGLTEETDTLLNKFSLEYPNLYHTFLPRYEDKETSRRNIALMIGIKAAKNDILLFTEADAAPANDRWLSAMMQEMTEDKEIVMGCCTYTNTKKFYNRIARFNNLLCTLQFLSMAIAKKPFLASFRNIAYKKHLFFNNKGFSEFLNYEYSEGLFLNHIMNNQNTTIALSQDSFMQVEIKSFSKWKEVSIFYQKIRNHITKRRYILYLFGLEKVLRYLFYAIFALSIPYSIITENWDTLAIIGFIFIVKTLIQMIILNKSAKYFKAQQFWFSFPLMEIMQPFYQGVFKQKSRKKER